MGGLREEQLAADPIAQFERWFADVVAADLPEPNAMIVGTATADGVPSVRYVLLKGYDERGFVFYTNYDSRKGGELAANPRAALLFPWHELERQVRIEGRVVRTSEAQSVEYFQSRPRGSQLGAWASPQSAVLPSRRQVEDRLAAVTARFGAGEDDPPLPLPDFWGGFRVVPEVIEFWQGRADRLHDRLRYRRTAEGWTVERLAP